MKRISKDEAAKKLNLLKHKDLEERLNYEIYKLSFKNEQQKQYQETHTKKMAKEVDEFKKQCKIRRKKH